MRTKFILSLFVFSSLSFAKLNVVTTTQDLSSLVHSIGGELVETNFIAKGIQDPHYVEAKPSFMVLLNRADLVISIGLSLESGWLPLILRGARKPDILPGNPGFLAVSEVVQPIEVVAQADRADGDVHPEGNPHFMADPERALKVAKRISEKLGELDPKNLGTYQANFGKFQSALELEIKNWKERFKKYQGLKIVGYHKTFNYLFDWLHFQAVGYLEPKPGVPPTPQHILNLIELSKKSQVKLIIVENFFDPKPGKSLSEKTGAKLLVLPAYVGGEDGTADYISWLHFLLNHIEDALKR